MEHGLRALHDMAMEQGPKPLSGQQLKMAVQIAKDVADLLAKGNTLNLQVHLVYFSRVHVLYSIN